MDRTLRGKVTRVDAQGAYVEVPKLGVGVEFGPCQVLRPFVLDEVTEIEDEHSHPVSHSMGGGRAEPVPHRHDLKVGLEAIKPGHEVLVSTVNGVKEDLVVLGRLA